MADKEKERVNIFSTIARYFTVCYLRANTYDLLIDWKTSLTAVPMSIKTENYEWHFLYVSDLFQLT